MQVSGLTKAFGPRTLFSGASFRIGPGDRLAIVGRNGAGKTTLLRILAGLEVADSGSVSIPRGERVALHDQRPDATSAGTVREYVGCNVDVSELHRAEATAREHAETVVTISELGRRLHQAEDQAFNFEAKAAQLEMDLFTKMEAEHSNVLMVRKL